MHKLRRKKIVFSLSTLAIASFTYAATPIDLRQAFSSQILQGYITPNKTLASQPVALKKIKSEIDSRHTVHTRIKQTYAGIPVWGADAVIHTPKAGKKALAALVSDKTSTFTGIVYHDLEKDLQDRSMLNERQKQNALEKAKNVYRSQHPNATLYRHEKVEPIVFVLKTKAHYAYKVSFSVLDKNNSHLPIMILDAKTLDVYSSWDNRQTAEIKPVESIGGNSLIGKLFYDDQPNHFEKLRMKTEGTQCYFENEHVIFKRSLVSDIENDSYPPIVGACHEQNGSLKMDLHDKNSYEGADSYNGAYSPASDTLYGVMKTQELFKTWYHIPAFDNGKGDEEKIVVLLHHNSAENTIDNEENAAFDSEKKVFEIGDGSSKERYPFSTLEVLAHELAHGFTFQHANLVYKAQSGGMNEAFSDMAAKAVEYMMTGKNTWTLGYGVHKDGTPLRYMDEPTKDGSSIDHIKNYTSDDAIFAMDPHYTSGIFNKAFYHLATTPGWNTKKAFDVMVEANRFYWIPTSTFQQGACDAVMAAKELNYNISDVEKAFEKVGLTNLHSCTKSFSPIFPIDNTKVCRYTGFQYEGDPAALLNRDEIPCHVGSFSPVFIPIEKESTEISYTNYKNYDVQLSIRYFKNCDKVPRTRGQEDFTLPALSSRTFYIETDCMTDKYKRSVITTVVSRERNHLPNHVVINYK